MSQSTDAVIRSLLANQETRNKGFEMMVHSYAPLLYNKVRSIVLVHEDTNDILQNTFLKAWNHLEEFKGDSKVSTWLYRIAINEALDFLRKQKKKQVESIDIEYGAIATKLLADDYFDGDQTQALLHEAIATLPLVQRTVFNLRYFEEMPYKEMSKVLETSEGALKSSYHFAMVKISQYLKQHQ